MVKEMKIQNKIIKFRQNKIGRFIKIHSQNER